MKRIILVLMLIFLIPGSAMAGTPAWVLGRTITSENAPMQLRHQLPGYHLVEWQNGKNKAWCSIQEIVRISNGSVHVDCFFATNDYDSKVILHAVVPGVKGWLEYPEGAFIYSNAGPNSYAQSTPLVSTNFAHNVRPGIGKYVVIVASTAGNVLIRGITFFAVRN